MSSNQSTPQSKTQRNVIPTLIGVFLAICALVVIGYFAMLVLLGPQIANIFSRVTNGLSR